MAAARAIPEGHQTVSPYLIVDGGARALSFYAKAFGATELCRVAGPDGKIGHAEIRIGDSVVMLADVHAEIGAHDPHHFKGSPVSLHVYVEDVDAVARQAIAAGVTVKRPVQDMFYGDRSVTFEDPFGHTWHVATHKEDVSAEEIARRAAAQNKA
jgi:PhnB protein